ncbi:MAG: HAD-IIIC family phosphatase [Elusimicrobia bacterium]|nr:HAD-IIIC family phosphatase [Elusimicrobiota bacterium]
MSRLSQAKALAERGEAGAAAEALRAGLAEARDCVSQLNAAKILAKIAGHPDVAASLHPLRLAVLGSSTTTQLIPLLRLHAFREGLNLEVYESPFGAFQQEILDPGSGLYRFQPRIALLFVNYRDVRPGPLEAEASRWTGLWDALRERARCAVVMNNFDLPVERPWGNIEAKRPEAGIGRLRALNALLASRAGSGMVILDQEHLSAVIGKERWHDPRFWLHARQAIALEALPRYAAEAAALLKALAGRSRKVLAVDLDDTLWGGIVGDDGAAGLELGQTPAGEAFLEFQRYLKSLRERGVLLAVCSKNDPERAREPFAARAEMVLRLDDFSAFEAGWHDKAEGLRRIARALNVGLDAVAFVDDSPLERELVRRCLPEVAVVDLPEDPADRVRALDSLRLFETAGVSAEDLGRASHFQAESGRESLKREAPDMASFLRDLEMAAEAGPFTESDIDRITQLINKTNQFNLTTRRYGTAEVRALMRDPSCWTLSVRLRDRFGDYGLISVLAARLRGKALEVDSWLMSCRVFSRGVEHLAFNLLLEAARRLGAAVIAADYIPTPKNAPARELLPGLGFRQDSDGRWRLPVAEAREREVAIRHGSQRTA